jgi:hypothetical protein
MQRRTIYVHPGIERLGAPLVAAMEQLAPVMLRSSAEPEVVPEGAWVLIVDADETAAQALLRRRLHCFVARTNREAVASESAGARVAFPNSIRLDGLLRGRTIAHRRLPACIAPRVGDGDEVLAQLGKTPAWVLRSRDGWPAHEVGLPLPVSDQAQPFDFLNGLHFMQLLPLLHFLREAAAELDWQRAPLRACFTIDDPNLHWPTYGFLSYQRLAERARAEGFHVAVGTVPLDAWAAHPRTVALLREHAQHLSLLMHGNDHRREELGRDDAAPAQQALLAQALVRVERLERASGLAVDRVIVPPHEALAASMAAQLPGLGIEAASLSSWSLRHWNPQAQPHPAFGLEPAEPVGQDGLVIGRHALSADATGPCVIAAWLGMPINLAAHHQQLSDDLQTLSSAASLINSLGKVRWCGLQEALRANLLVQRQGNSLVLRPHALRFCLKVPEGVGRVTVIGARAASLPRVWHRGAAGLIVEGEPFEVRPGESLQLQAAHLGSTDRRGIRSPGWSLPAMLRRLLCEMRDRLVPLTQARRV